MTSHLHPLSFLSQAVLRLVLALALAFGLAAPQPAQAGRGDAVGILLGTAILGGAAYCATHPDKCGQNGGRSGGGGGGGPVDAIALTQEQAMWVQQGLQRLGFYYGAIDGAFGAGSRSAVRAYQASLGEPQTGAMTGKQINDLVALAPAFAGVPAGDPFLFNADLANDVTNAEMRQIQAELNRQGFNAGSVDGAFGGMTRTAVGAYKARYALPGGPVASRRLLAHMMGWTPAGQPAVQGAVTPVAPMPVPVTPEPVVVPTTPAFAGDLRFDLLGLGLGMNVSGAEQVIAAELGPDVVSETASGETYGGGAMLGLGTLTEQASWPVPPAERMLTLYDPTRPELGVVAAFRMIHMPDGVDQAVFESQVLPDIVAKYGPEGRVGDSLTWVGNGVARAAAIADPARLAACGDLRLASVADGLWAAGGGVHLDPLSLGSVSADCGEVLSVRYEGQIIRIGIWNSAALSGAVTAPAIKF